MRIDRAIAPKVSSTSVDHFLDFITPSHILKDIPFGQRTLKLESGKVLHIPNVFRSVKDLNIIE